MIENWLTWSLPGKSGRPSIISAKMQPADQMSTTERETIAPSARRRPKTTGQHRAVCRAGARARSNSRGKLVEQ